MRHTCSRRRVREGRPQGSYYASQGWKNNDLSVAPGLIPLYIAELAKPKYLHAGEKSLLKDYEQYH